MFRIAIASEYVEMNGLEALDERRRLGLPDGAHLIVRPRDVTAPVDEAFARANFSSWRSTCESRVAPIRFLVPGDLSEHEGAFRLKKDLPAERVRALWLAANWLAAKK